MKTFDYIYDKDTRQIFIPFKFACINALVAVMDGLPICFVGKSKKPWIALEEAIAWHKKELPYSSLNGLRQKAIDTMEKKNKELLLKHANEQ